jgi:hypothetical protein
VIGKVNVVQRGDAFTAAEVKDMLESRAWNMYAERIDSLIENFRTACERADSMDQLRDAQGGLKAAKRVKELPEVILRELAKR